MKLILPLLFPAWLLWGAAEPVSGGTLIGQILLGALSLAILWQQNRNRDQDRLDREQKVRLDREAHAHAAADRQRIMDEMNNKAAEVARAMAQKTEHVAADLKQSTAEVADRLEVEVKKNTAVTVAAASHAGNGAAEVVKEIVREYDDLAERRRRERADNARLRSAAGTGRQDHETGPGDAGGLLPPASGPGQ